MRWRTAIAAGVAGFMIAVSAWAQSAATPLPPFAELEAAGARIGEIRVVPQNVFDLADPKENNALFRLANRLHVQTRPEVIRRALLFTTGEPLSARAIEETERILRGTRYLYDVQIRPVAWHDGVVDIEVLTRDAWTLDPGVSVGRSGGQNTSGAHLNEYNLLGTGVSVHLARTNQVDRSGSEIAVSDDRAFGTWTSVALAHANNDDGRRDALSVVRPFYALDARWAAGFAATDDARIDPIYRAGEVESEYRHREQRLEAFGGWSAGLADGWVQRWSLGASFQDHAYAVEPGRVAPPRLPGDEKLVGPFARYDLIEDRFDRELNRNLIGRPEFFALGLAASVRLGWAGTALGSSTDALLYTASLARGFEPGSDTTVIAAGTLDGRVQHGLVRRQRLGVQTQLYHRQGRYWLFYAAASADALTRPDVGDALLLGGDNGLRGYPLRYQSGERRALVTLEERFYTGLYVWRLFRVGGAAFLDAGRAWHGDTVNRTDSGWLGNVGIGLRIVSARSAFENVLHLDIAVPVHAAPGIKRVQWLVKTKASF